MPIPEALTSAPYWSVSGENKIAIAPRAYLTDKTIRNYAPKKYQDQLVSYPLAKKIQSDLKGAYLPVIYLQSGDYIIVDIEPSGMAQDHPLFELPYIYAELSRNGGLHGILPFNPPEEYQYLKDLTKIKLDELETEFMIGSNQPITLTEDELDLSKDLDQRLTYAYSETFQAAFSKWLDNFGQTRTTNRLDIEERQFLTPLSEEESKLLEKLQIDPLTEHSGDLSTLEWKKWWHIGATLLELEPSILTLPDQDATLKLARLIYYGSLTRVPWRKKHDRASQSTRFPSYNFREFRVTTCAEQLLQIFKHKGE